MPKPWFYGYPKAGPIEVLCDPAHYDVTYDAAQKEWWVKLPAGIGLGATLVDGTWTNPPAPPAPEPPASAFVDDVPTFFDRFLPGEEEAIRALAAGDPTADPPTPPDTVAVVFMRRLDDQRTLRVNRALPTVQAGIAYFAGQAVPGLGQLPAGTAPLAPARVAQLLAPSP